MLWDEMMNEMVDGEDDGVFPRRTSSLVPSGNDCHVGTSSTMWSLTQSSQSISRRHMAFFSGGSGSSLQSCPKMVAANEHKMVRISWAFTKLHCKQWRWRWFPAASSDRRGWWSRWRWRAPCRRPCRSRTCPRRAAASRTAPSSSPSLSV